MVNCKPDQDVVIKPFSTDIIAHTITPCKLQTVYRFA